MKIHGISAVLLLTFLTKSAVAQTASITVANASSLPRVDASGTQLAKRSISENPEWVSDQDCVDDQRIRFTLSLTDYAVTASLLAYAAINGQDCSDPTQRSGPTSQCWPIVRAAGAANLTNTGPAKLSLLTQQNVDIPVRTLMAGALLPRTPDYSEAICGKVPLTSVSVQFLYFDPGNVATPSVVNTVPITVDTIDPPDGTLADGGTGTGTANGVGCNTTGAAPLGVTTALLGLAMAAFVRRRRR